MGLLFCTAGAAMNAPFKTTMQSPRGSTLRRIVAALIGGEAWHFFSWAALPLVACVACIFRGRA